MTAFPARLHPPMRQARPEKRCYRPVYQLSQQSCYQSVNQYHQPRNRLNRMVPRMKAALTKQLIELFQTKRTIESHIE